MRFFVLATGLLILIFYGISIFFTPSYEVMYNHRILPIIQSGNGEIHVHILEIGNTGKKTQEHVDILLESSIMHFETIPISVRNFGIVDRQFTVSENGSTTRVSIGLLETDKRVELRVCLFFENSDEVYEWDDFFMGIEIERGKTVSGDPKWTSLGRFLFNIFGEAFKKYAVSGIMA